MNIKISSEEELIEVAIEAIHLLNNLRHVTKLWNESHGCELRSRKKYYEELCDKFLEKLKVTEHREAKQIKIEIE